MFNVYQYPDAWDKLVVRPSLDASKLRTLVEEIITNVKLHGDEALREYALKFDGVNLASLAITRDEINANDCPAELQNAIDTACHTITTFHSAQFEKTQRIETARGVWCWRKSLPIERVGLYIPGGRAPLFSTLLMLALPAKIAGCREIVLCTPADKNGKINPAILCAAKKAGVDKIFKVGGAQAIAAMAYGTESIPKVDKIFGPGNQYVTCAKTLAAAEAGVAIDMPAGPTEVLVIADKYCNPSFVAADLLSQAEHGPDSQVILVTDDADVLEDVQKELQLQLSNSERREIMEQALSHSRLVLLHSLDEAIEFANLYAPEHLVLAVKDAESLAEKVRSAGSVFLGNYAAESFGDYAAGVNHTLPTAGAARAYSGVSLDSFLKKITFQTLNAQGVHTIGYAAETMAKAEGLYAHANAVTVRLKEVEKSNEKEFSVRNLLRENIRQLAPYVCARHEFKGTAETLLDANENSVGSVSNILLNRYPDPLQLELKAKLANVKGVNSGQILLTNGSDEAIDLLIRTFCNPQLDEIVIMPPTYGMYEVCAGINDVRVKRVDLTRDFQIDKEGVKNALTTISKIVFICSPNNPSANLLHQDDIEDIVQSSTGLVVVDEAYIDFAGTPSFITKLSNYPNLVVLQTFSKAFGMAGARLGMLFASKEIINILNNVKAPYNVNSLTIEAALNALVHLDKKEAMQKLLIEEREKLASALKEFKFVKCIYPSDANFLLVKVDDAYAYYDYLKEHGVIVRNRSTAKNCENCLRITVGTPEENQKVIELSKKFVS